MNTSFNTTHIDVLNTEKSFLLLSYHIIAFSTVFLTLYGLLNKTFLRVCMKANFSQQAMILETDCHH